MRGTLVVIKIAIFSQKTLTLGFVSLGWSCSVVFFRQRNGQSSFKSGGFIPLFNAQELYDKIELTLHHCCPGIVSDKHKNQATLLLNLGRFLMYVYLGSDDFVSLFNTQTMQIKSILNNGIAMLFSYPNNPAGFKLRSSVSEAEVMTVEFSTGLCAYVKQKEVHNKQAAPVLNLDF
jgi:hypothetical protein